LVSNGVAMFVLLNRVVHVVCLHRGGRDSQGFPGLSIINERFRSLAFFDSLTFVKVNQSVFR